MADAPKKRKRKSNEAISQVGESMMPKEKRQQAAARLLAAEETKRNKTAICLLYLLNLQREHRLTPMKQSSAHERTIHARCFSML